MLHVNTLQILGTGQYVVTFGKDITPNPLLSLSMVPSSIAEAIIQYTTWSTL